MGIRSSAEKQRQRNALATRAEAIVAAKLEDQGFSILGRNVRMGHDELDIVARRGRLLVICEVRSRKDTRYIDPSHTITAGKRAAVRRATAALLRNWNLGGVDVRLDVASVVFDGAQPRVTYLPGAL